MTLPAADVIGELFASEGARDYLGEPVSVGAHLLQAGALAEAAGAPGPVVAAALLHDIGHLPLPGPSRPASGGNLVGRDLMAGTDTRHGVVGAEWLAAWFGPEVTEPVRLHVAAKRYLCATEPSYVARLSEASVYTLSVQGGPMSAAEARAFSAHAYAADAIAVRRWDDQAKDPSASPPDFAHFIGLLERLQLT
jgi:gamma-butyrobetaine dioxygenase